jgi:hypothetical protein
VFDEVRVENLRSPTEPGADVEFTVSGEIARGFIDARDLRDYATHNAAAFIYGEITDEQIAAAEEAERLEREAREAERRRAERGEAPSQTASAEGEEDAAGDGVAGEPGSADGPRRGRRDGSSRRPAANEEIAREMAESGESAALADDEEIQRGRRELFEGGSQREREEAQLTPIPEPLTDEQIGELDNIGAMRARIARQKALRERDDLDADTRDRLEEEARRLVERAREAREESRG